MLPPFLRRYLPDTQTLRNSRMLRWLGPALHDPRLWRIHRRGVALGMALGVFFGLLIPVAQIPAAALAAFFLRAHIPAAVASTLVTNPLTFAPVYYAAFHLGEWLLGRKPTGDTVLDHVASETTTGLALWMDRLATVGVPLAVGLAVLAVTLSVLLYFAVHWAWRARITAAWRRRRLKRARARRAD